MGREHLESTTDLSVPTSSSQTNSSQSGLRMHKEPGPFPGRPAPTSQQLLATDRASESCWQKTDARCL